MDVAVVRVLAFDVFGTVVDWHTGVAAEVAELGLPVDADRFALAWRSRYLPTLQRVASGELDQAPLDALHRLMLEECLDDFGVHGLSEEQKRHLTHAWHRLPPWPDSVDGLTRLKRRYVISTLSNGNIGLLTHMAKHAGLPWTASSRPRASGGSSPTPPPTSGSPACSTSNRRRC